MASRDALRAFQSRLASRLQEARTSGAGAAWLAVDVSGSNYLFPLNHAGEIFPWTPVQSVPHARDWFLGVANLRGGLFGVVDLASFVAGRAPAMRSDATRAESRLVALNAVLEVNCALLIDRLSGLRSMEAFTTSSQAPEGSPPYFLSLIHISEPTRPY